MSGKEPYIDFYTGDWLKDQAVSRCTPATRGVWIDLLCAMHDDSRSGELIGTHDQLARLGRCSAAELALALTDLQTTGAADVTERNGSVVVRNRRMYRLAQDRAANRVKQRLFRERQKGSNPDVTGNQGGIALDSDTDLESFNLPEELNTQEFRARLSEWLAYKTERRESYKTQGMKSMVAVAAKRAASHGLQAVLDAMERAIANHWQGWDHPSCFSAQGTKNGKSKHVGSGQRYDGT